MRELRDHAGVSVLIYDQTCATEAPAPQARAYPDPARRVLINERVCEGCGDCSEQSHCLSVEPLETEFGRKRAINQSSCNKDFSCLKGFCPSFVTVEGGKLRKPQPLAPEGAIDDTLPAPAAPGLARPYGVFIAGVGGTGVVTIGQLLGMAAHIEGRGCSVLDMAGLAQKGGAVYSHVVLAAAPDQLMNTRVAMGEADLVLAGDLVVATSADAMARLSPGRTRVLLNSDTAPTAAFVKNPDWTLPGAAGLRIGRRVRQGACGHGGCGALAVALLGDAIYANPLMMGYAYQKGWLPLSRESLLRAIELNGQQVAANQAAFAWGRRAAQDLAGLNRLVAQGPKPASVYPEGIVELRRPRAAAPVAELKKPAGELEQLVSVRREFLTRYQDAAYAARYADLVDKVAHAEREATGTQRLALAVARYAFKLMAYKDEYEVARLYSDGEFERRVAQQFEGDWKLRFHLAPPLFAARGRQAGQARLRPGTLRLFRLLARLRRLRGTRFDPFGYTAERAPARAGQGIPRDADGHPAQAQSRQPGPCRGAGQRARRNTRLRSCEGGSHGAGGAASRGAAEGFHRDGREAGRDAGGLKTGQGVAAPARGCRTGADRRSRRSARNQPVVSVLLRRVMPVSKRSTPGRAAPVLKRSTPGRLGAVSKRSTPGRAAGREQLHAGAREALDARRALGLGLHALRGDLFALGDDLLGALVVRRHLAHHDPAVAR